MRNWLLIGLVLSTLTFSEEVQKHKEENRWHPGAACERTPEAEASTVVVALPKNGALIKRESSLGANRIQAFPLAQRRNLIAQMKLPSAI